MYNADEFEASGLKNITKYDESSKNKAIKPDSCEGVGEILRPFLMPICCNTEH